MLGLPVWASLIADWYVQGGNVMKLMKFISIPKKLWEHKKKSAFGFSVVYFIGRKTDRWKRDCDIRTLYAREAKKFGQIPITSEQRLRRVTVLVDPSNSSFFESFKKNALPLLNLAGLQIEIIKPAERSEFETVAEQIDKTNCDALYLVGGDDALSFVLSVMSCRNNHSSVPIGVFPGSFENRSLLSLAPNVFALQDDIRPQCESAMALIEEKVRVIYLSSVKFVNAEINSEKVRKSLFGVAALQAGLYNRVETNKFQLWYWGPLKRWIAYFTAIVRSLKQYPEMKLTMVCEEFCSGCSKCQSSAITSSNEKNKGKAEWKWWHYIIGSPKLTSNNTQSVRDYSTVKNEDCGKVRKARINAVDLVLENVQDENACGIRVRSGGDGGRSRFGLLLDGWKRCQTRSLFVSPDPDFYENDFVVRSATITFDLLPSSLKKVTVFGNDYQIDDDLKTMILFQSTDKYVHMFLPSSIRVL